MSDSVETRLQKLEDEVAELRAALDSVAQAPAVQPPPLPPPLVGVPNPLAYPQYTQPAAPQFSRPATPNVIPYPWQYYGPPKPPVSSEQAEVDFGKKAMPIIGAALIISGLYLLTVYVLENFQITKAMQFSFAAAGSILAFGLGEFVRKKIDQVGRALNAIGLVGGYLTIVSGSETFGVYPDTLMVPLFFALSLVNVGIGWYRKDQPLALMGVTAAFFSSAMVADRNLLLPALGSASTLIAMAITWRQR